MRPALFAATIISWLSFSAGTAASAAPNTGPCVRDMTQFCQGIQPELGGMLSCLKVNEAKLSKICRTHQQQVRAKLDSNPGACKENASQLCKGVTGKGRMYVCLSSNEVALSDACKQHLRGGVPADNKQ